jgi:organic hydroperoxide reductase OsmC/OhrA
MSSKEHHYTAKIIWTGNKGEGTTHAAAYERSHDIIINHKTIIHGSSDSAFRGDITKHNPEDLFLSSLSVCHMLWYLHLCADAGIIVIEYEDNPEGNLLELETGGGYFTSVTLKPQVTINDSTKVELANSLHIKANEKCFIANSCNFKVKHLPVCKIK